MTTLMEPLIRTPYLQEPARLSFESFGLAYEEASGTQPSLGFNRAARSGGSAGFWD